MPPPQHLEYDLLLAPGADAARPRLRYRGADDIRLDPATGHLLVRTTAGRLTETRPVAWQTDPATGVRQPVPCAFRLRGDEVSFEVGEYDPGRALTIDPAVEFASYTGSPVENWGFAATPDAARQPVHGRGGVRGGLPGHDGGVPDHVCGAGGYGHHEIPRRHHRAGGAGLGHPPGAAAGWSFRTACWLTTGASCCCWVLPPPPTTLPRPGRWAARSGAGRPFGPMVPCPLST